MEFGMCFQPVQAGHLRRCRRTADLLRTYSQLSPWSVAYLDEFWNSSPGVHFGNDRAARAHPRLANDLADVRGGSGGAHYLRAVRW